MSSKVCACRGIRRCALCKEVEGGADSPQAITSALRSKMPLYNYCYACQKAYPWTSPSPLQHCAHLPCGEDDDSIPLQSMQLYQNFLTEEDEAALVQQVDARSWCDSQSGRRKQDYGPKVNFKRQKLHLDQFTGLPDFSQSLLDKVREEVLLADFQCAELCNLEYIPQRESCIDAHIDDQWLWGERLVTLNLLSSTYLTLTPLHPLTDGSFPLVRVYMPRRSLFVMSGDSRHVWKHAIQAMDITERRLAMTFRELTAQFVTGSHQELGKAILERAYTFMGDVVGSAEKAF